MLLGKKRSRAPITRTTTLLDLNLPPAAAAESQPSDHGLITTVDEHHHNGILNQRLVAINVSRRDFLRSCFLCKRQLLPGRDIYMYRGDRAFCSLECRQHEITLDQKKDKVKLASTATGSAQGDGVSAAD